MIDLKHISLIKSLLGLKGDTTLSAPRPALVEISPTALRQVSGGSKVAGGVKPFSPAGNW
jgi:hypothetical protein